MLMPAGQDDWGWNKSLYLTCLILDGASFLIATHWMLIYLPDMLSSLFF